MAAGLSAAGKNVALDALGDVAVYVSLHTADPGTTGTNEVTGGTPAYARKAAEAWASASGGSMSAYGTDPVFDVPACTVAYAGLWSASTAGTFYGSAQLTSETFSAQGTYTLTGFTISL